MYRQRSPLSSPSRKRQRLSSPTYEDQFADLTQEDLASFDEIEARISQGIFTNYKVESEGKQCLESGDMTRFPLDKPPSSAVAVQADADKLPDDVDNPFGTRLSANNISQGMWFTTAAALPMDRRARRSPSPEGPPPETNYEDWFTSAPVVIPVNLPGFTKASAAGDISKADSVLMPSEAAFARATAKMAAWQKEDTMVDGPKDETSILPASYSVGFKTASSLKEPHSPKRPALTTLTSVLNVPDAQSQALSTSATADKPPKSTVSSLRSQRQRAFRSPLPVGPQTPIRSNGLSLNQSSTSLGFTSASGNPHPLSVGPFVTSRQLQNATGSTSIGQTTPIRSTTPASTSRTRPAKFVPPFRDNMTPSGIDRRPLPQSGKSTWAMPQKSAFSITKENPNSIKSQKKFFSLTPPPGRKTLASSGLQPQQYNAEDLKAYGIDITTLNKITMETALYYVFHGHSRSSGLQPVLGPSEALRELQQHGCTLATKPWVDNHWCLILWKLAGMVVLDPERETTPQEKRWSWSEMIRQLLYRYERELNSGVRPPLRKIANQDTPASCPMVLCISNIFWSPGGITEDGLPIEPHPELEVTDGWYRLRAQIDIPLAKAVRRGVIKVGRKIGIAGARLSTERKEPTEILEAYNSTKLIFSANSSHLVSWHEKLGFMRGPCISTLHKLDADGGVVTALDFVITKVYPIAFLEFIETENGKKDRVGPRNEAEEFRVHEEWKKRREKEASKLREEYNEKYSRYETYIQRLETKAGKHLNTTEDEDVEDLFDKLEYPDSAAQVLSRVSPSQAAWLAKCTRQHVELGIQNMAEEIERELQDICPCREVRAFRVLLIQDSRTLRRPANRTAKLTVWDVLSLSLDEGGKAGNFAVGQRYLISNVAPTSLSAWMDRSEPGSEIFLSTRRDTRWTRIKV